MFLLLIHKQNAISVYVYEKPRARLNTFILSTVAMCQCQV